MEKKYELTDETLNYNNRILYRIKALREFEDVKEGTLGGFVESENNLSHEGDCWIYNNAKVFDKAVVENDSKIFDAALIHGAAYISGNSRIGHYAEIYGNARIVNALVTDNAMVYDNSLVENSSISDDAKIYGYTMVVHSHIRGYSKVYGRVSVRNADIIRDAIIKSDADYIVFKNSFSSGRFFTWTRSNNKWSVGCFYGSGEELIAKAYQDNPLKGKYYAEYVDLVRRLNEVDKYADEIYEVIPFEKVPKYSHCEGFESNCFPKDDNDGYYINKEWKQKCYEEENIH